jgi:hypothetical protein
LNFFFKSNYPSLLTCRQRHVGVEERRDVVGVDGDHEQGHDGGEEPGVDEEVLAAPLDDPDEQREDRHGQAHRQDQLLGVVFDEERECLRERKKEGSIHLRTARNIMAFR